MVAAAAACGDPEPVEPTATALAMTGMDATPTSTDAVPTPAVTPVPAVPTSTPLPTPTAAPSSTPVPTATAVPTAIPPTRTAVPVVVVAVTPVAVEYLPNREALVALYNSTDGDNWRRNDNWLSNKPIGEWFGVFTNERGRVIKLDLAENGLNGPISPELGNLTRLTTLYLLHNRLSGPIPPELGNLTNLVVLFLYGNDLTGCIPSALQHISNNDLEELGLPFCGPEQAGTTVGNRLQQVKDRGKVICAGRVDIPGLGYLDQSGNNVGVEADLCRAVASGVLGDPNAIEIRLMTAAER